MLETQLTSTVVMVSPNHFGFNPQTAATNIFQHHVSFSEQEVQKKALAEFTDVTNTLQQQNIHVFTLPSREDVITPDAVFPNNWFSHHTDGTLVFYPMLAENRRQERQKKALKDLLEKNNISVSRTIDLSEDEEKGNVLEGTGSLVLDREHKVAFAMESPRTTQKEFEKWCKEMAYEGILFHAYDAEGFPIYHTNVTMSIGKQYAIISLDSIKDEREKDMVSQKLKELDKDIISLSVDQIYRFCGNILQLETSDFKTKIVMSQIALDGFTSGQRQQLETYGDIIAVTIPTIETVGGGSARCMLAEVFPQK